jgi:hypothetical protein
MSSPTPDRTKRLYGLRVNTPAAAVILLVQYSLAIAVNLYSSLQASDHGKSVALALAIDAPASPSGAGRAGARRGLL